MSKLPNNGEQKQEKQGIARRRSVLRTILNAKRARKRAGKQREALAAIPRSGRGRAGRCRPSVEPGAEQGCQSCVKSLLHAAFKGRESQKSADQGPGRGDSFKTGRELPRTNTPPAPLLSFLFCFFVFALRFRFCFFLLTGRYNGHRG